MFLHAFPNHQFSADDNAANFGFGLLDPANQLLGTDFCHMIYVNGVSRQRWNSQICQNVVIESHHRNVLRHTDSIFFQSIQQHICSNITVTGKRSGQLRQTFQRNCHLSFCITIRENTIFRHSHTSFPHGTAIAIIAVSDTAGGIDRTHKDNIPMSHLQQVIHHGIHAVIAVGDHGVPMIPCVKRVQHYQGNFSFRQHISIGF